MTSVRQLKIYGPFTTTERNAYSATGTLPPYTIILNSTTAQFEFWTGTAWQVMPSNSPTFVDLTTTGTSILGDSLFDITTITNLNVSMTIQMVGSRLRLTQGIDRASANDLTFPTLGGTQDGNSFEITGTTQINAISTSNWQDGSIVTFLFASTPTVKHNTAGGAGTVPVLLAGAMDFVAAAGDTLTLILGDVGGTQAWREVSRTLVATTQTYTESNVTTDRSYDANATTIDELADVLGTLIADLRAKRIVA